MAIRKAAVAGSWYPGSAAALAAAVDGHLAAVSAPVPAPPHLLALVAPHAGLIYSGPVAAYAYALLRDCRVDTIVLVGPSHFVGFDGVALFRGGFDTPLGIAALDEMAAAALVAAAPRIVREEASAHGREHSLEMQLPFIRRLAPEAKVVPLLMGWQTAETARGLGDALAAVAKATPERRMLLVASTDLSHYHDARTAARLDAVVIEQIARLDPDGLQRALDAVPDHACGGGPTVAVMRAARQLGANQSVILKYADSGDVSGDKTAVVGYLAAAIGRRR